MRRKEPVRLYPKKQKKIEINSFILLFIAIVIITILSIALAVACKSPYNMVWA